MQKALLFLNGIPPKKIPDYSKYQFIGCADGAFNYLMYYDCYINFILGDLDSIKKKLKNDSKYKIIISKNQKKTDFEKVLDYLIKKKIYFADVFGATGLEHDHFLGNISVALKFFNKIKITFFDDYGRFFLIKNKGIYQVRKGANISMIPLNQVTKVTTEGLKYSLIEKKLKLGNYISIRNKSINTKIKINFKKGNLLLFIGD